MTGVLILIGALVIMLRLDWLLTVTAIGIAPVFWFLIRGFGRPIERRSKRYHEEESALVSTLQESLSSIRAVQAFSREPETALTMRNKAGKSLEANQRLVLTQLLFSAAVGLAMALGTAAVVGIGAQRVISGGLTIGDILVFLAYLGMLYNPMNAFSQSSGALHSARAQLERVFKVLATPPGIVERTDARTLETVQGRNQETGVQASGTGFPFPGPAG